MVRLSQGAAGDLTPQGRSRRHLTNRPPTCATAPEVRSDLEFSTDDQAPNDKSLGRLWQRGVYVLVTDSGETQSNQVDARSVIT